ncbi:MAG: hypothetical protein ICV73_25035 [Acetobacteraceae bacterium]|nr:hypothetical protein [Acetobacteraceae bacterium]
MELTPDQLAAALACGCALAPATEDQVRRLSAQRRVFRFEGRPLVATRDGFLETHGTLSALIEKHRPAASRPDAETGAAPVQEHAAQTRPEPAPVLAEPAAVPAQQDDAEAPPAKPRQPRTRRPKPPAASADAVPTGEAAAARSEAEGMLAAVSAEQGSGARVRVLGRGRRAGQPPTPRWMVAGKMRRGRLK